MTILNFPIKDSDAKSRAAVYENVDPFPSIPAALLSSAEIYDYAAITGMLHPFYQALLKSASYEAHIDGEVIWWDKSEIRQQKIVRRGDPLVLGPNSITFVQVEPVFRLPNYIAVRFNLRITHVHRGLLLGTGPLVDPGFHGKLLIPLHNLTSSDYAIDTTQALIWIEFTKTTFGITPADSCASSPRQFRGFPPDKRHMTADQYLRKANAGNPIASSIPKAIGDAQRSARDAKRLVQGVAWVGAIALLLTVGSILVGGYNLLHSSISLSRAVKQDIVSLSVAASKTSQNMANTQAKIDELDKRTKKLERDLESARSGKP